MSDLELGKKVFRSFWNWSKTFYGNSFDYTFEEFLNFYGKKLNIYLDGIGGGVREAQLSDSKIDAAMRALAKDSMGKVPSNPLQMFKYLSNEATKVDFVDAAIFVTKESVIDVIKGTEAIGSSIITTGKMLTYIFPAIVLILVFFWLNTKTNGQLVKVIKRK